MDLYSPLFSRIVDSSLWLEEDFVVKVFITMLAKKDADNVVRGTAFNIASWAKKTEKETIEALKILSSPDTKRLEPQPFEGRRIERVEDGWLLLNGRAYQELMQVINRRAYQRQKQAEYRAKKKDAGPRKNQGSGAADGADVISARNRDDGGKPIQGSVPSGLDNSAWSSGPEVSESRPVSDAEPRTAAPVESQIIWEGGKIRKPL